MDLEMRMRALCTEQARDASELAMFLAMLVEPLPETRKAPKRGPYGVQGCGTRAGYQHHRDRGQTACTACKTAQDDYMREYQRTHYSPERRRRQYEAAKARGYYARKQTAA